MGRCERVTHAPIPHDLPLKEFLYRTTPYARREALLASVDAYPSRETSSQIQSCLDVIPFVKSIHEQLNSVKIVPFSLEHLCPD